MKSYTVYIYDNTPATHVMTEISLPEDVIIRSHGFFFAPPSFTKDLGPPDDEVTIGPMIFPAWKTSNGEPPNIEMDNKIPN